MNLIKKQAICLTAVGIFTANMFIPAALAGTKDMSLRQTIQNMIGKVNWMEKDRSAVVEVGAVKAVIKLDSVDATLDGKSLKLDKKPYIEKGVMYVSPTTIKQIQELVLQKQNRTGLDLLATYQMPGGKAEISYSTPDGHTLLVTEAAKGTVSIVDITDVQKVSVKKSVSFKTISADAEVTSVTVSKDGKYGLAAVRMGDDVDHANRGIVGIIDLKTGSIVKTYHVGIGPDSIALTKNGNYLVICNEDEENDPAQDNEIDMKKTKRPGSISILQFKDGNVLKGKHKVIPLDISNVGNGAVYLHDPQPEYVAISPDDSKAAITLQENNAVALIDIKAKKIMSIFGLGVTEHNADLKNDGIHFFTQTMKARPEPDGIAWSLDGRYLVTANEGDLGKNEFKDGIWAGGRNISVWSLDGQIVYDSMELVDKQNALAGLYPEKRSDKKGSEVENLTVGIINGKPLLAVAAERANSILFFDAADMTKPQFLGVIPSGGEAPEGIHKVNNRDLFVSCDENSGTLSFYGIK